MAMDEAVKTNLEKAIEKLAGNIIAGGTAASALQWSVAALNITKVLKKLENRSK